MLRKRQHVLLHFKGRQYFLPWNSTVPGFIIKRVFVKPRCSLPLQFQTGTSLEKPEGKLSRRKAIQNHFKGISFYMWNFWHYTPLDGSKCCGGDRMWLCCVTLKNVSRYLQCSRTMGEKIMYTCMCNWVPMLYSGKKSLLGDIKIKNQLKFFKIKLLPPKSNTWEYTWPRRWKTNTPWTIKH